MADEFWEIVVVEDTLQVQQQVKDFLERRTCAEKKLRVEAFSDFADARSRISARKIDLLVLDIFEGAPSGSKAEQTPGLGILKEVQELVFVPVIIYTAAPERVKDVVAPFVAVIGKADPKALASIGDKIEEFFKLKIPQTARAVNAHLERTLRDYMWGFVQKNWDTSFKGLVDKPEFVRILLQRLAHAVTRKEIAEVEADIFGKPPKPKASDPTRADAVHPVEMYVMPPMNEDVSLGNIRMQGAGKTAEFWVVLWPSCDTVTSGGRKAKTEDALCVRGSLLKDSPEFKQWSKDKAKAKNLRNLMKNTRDPAPGITKERFHFLPGVVDMPDLVLDFQALKHFPLTELRTMTQIATLASPFSESLAARFSTYLLRLGTPPLDIDEVIERLKE